MTSAEIWGLIFQGLLVVAAFGVAFMAIFGDAIRPKFWGPKLRLRLHDPEGELIPKRVRETGEEIATRYYHLKVTNKRRSVSAKNVRVILVQVAKLAPDGTFSQGGLSGPLQLRWQHTEFHLLYPTIGPDDICDLGFLSQGKRFELTPYVRPNNFERFLEANQRIRIEVMAVAENAESNLLCLEISWNGKWSADTEEMKRNLVIKEYK